jgi:hypothetical protein
LNRFAILFYILILILFLILKLREIIKRIIRDRYKDIEDEFKRIDRSSYGELTQDLLYHLFKRFVFFILFK